MKKILYAQGKIKSSTFIHVVILCCLSLFFIFPMVSALSDNELIYCGNQNYTLTDCVGFWNEIRGIIENVSCPTCPICDYSNYTLTSEIPECVNDSFQDELSKIDDYAKRGFEPVFEKGIIVNWRKMENITCDSNFSCDELVSVAVVSAREEERKNCENYSDNNSSSNNNIFYCIMGAIVLLVIFVFFFFKKNPQYKPSFSNSSYQVSKPPLTKIPEPPKPDEESGVSDGF
jgi:hypothetical protein